MKLMKGMMAALLLGLCAAAVQARADGLYVLGDVGGKTILNQDFNDFFSTSPDSPWFDAVGVPEGGVTLGYRFRGPFALEAGVNFTGSRSATDEYLNDTLQVQPMTSYSAGPVLCWDRHRWWFAESGVTEIGLKVSYATLNGSETVDNFTGNSSQNFSGSTTGFGVFIRVLNIWNPAGVTLGLEAGYDYQRFDDLTLSDTSGYYFAGTNGQRLLQYDGSNAYIDNSGGYLRLVFGWSSVPVAAGDDQPVSRPYRRAYQDEGY